VTIVGQTADPLRAWRRPRNWPRRDRPRLSTRATSCLDKGLMLQFGAQDWRLVICGGDNSPADGRGVGAMPADEALTG